MQAKLLQSITLIRLYETMASGAEGETRYGLEEALNANISFVASHAYEPTPSGNLARDTIRMVARHRENYPFKANNPCINKMVSAAFEVLQWDGKSSPPHPVYWSE